MKVQISVLPLSFAALAFAGTAFAQDHSGHGNAAMAELPAACNTGEAPSMAGMDSMQSSMEGMGEHQQAMMQSMMKTHGPMMQGMMAEDPDVAFACGMIPHHQSAIDMAEIQLQHGDSDEMKKLAQEIIDAQKKEIEQLTKWIETQS